MKFVGAFLFNELSNLSVKLDDVLDVIAQVDISDFDLVLESLLN